MVKKLGSHLSSTETKNLIVIFHYLTVRGLGKEFPRNSEGRAKLLCNFFTGNKCQFQFLMEKEEPQGAGKQQGPER
jgi:hypothetical protein